MKEVKIKSIEIEAIDWYPIEIEDMGNSIMVKQNNDWISWPKEAIPKLIETLQQFTSTP